MKSIIKISTTAICLLLIGLLAGCSKNDDKPEKELIVKTSQVSNILVTSAICGGELSSIGNSDIIESGVVIGTSPNPALKKLGASSWLNTSDSNPFSIEVDKLRSNTEYYVRAYASTKEETIYGNQEMFTTMARPVITIEDVDYFSGQGLVITCNIASDGGLTIKERGLVYGTTENPTIENNILTDLENGIGEYILEINEHQLTVPTYYRAYAKNDGGIFYGEQSTYTGP